MTTPSEPPVMHCIPLLGIGEVRPGDDIAAIVLEHAGIENGDIVVVTSKIVSKAEGRIRTGQRSDALDDETVRVLARRGETAIVRNRQGLVLAGAGIDASNTEPGTVLLLPEDPDASARRIRDGIAAANGARVGVVISDTAGRAWRRGQTDIAVGAAGIEVADDHSGRVDSYGNELAVTVTAIADELAAAADLVKGKLRGCPVAVIRGLSHLVLDDGPGARALQRSDDEDLFGLGARQAALGALGAVTVEQTSYGAPAGKDELLAALRALPTRSARLDVRQLGADVEIDCTGGAPEDRARLETLVDAVCFACGWVPVPTRSEVPSRAFAPGP